MHKAAPAMIIIGVISLSSVANAIDCPDPHSQMLNQLLLAVQMKYVDKQLDVEEGQMYRFIIERATRPVDEEILDHACTFFAARVYRSYPLNLERISRVLGGCPEGTAERVLKSLEEANDPVMRRTDSSEYLPIMRVHPVYPESALEAGLSGEVILEFTVTKKGKVRRPKVIESSDSVFDRAALDAVKKFLYKPEVRDGRPVSTNGVKVKITFGHPDAPSPGKCPDYGPPKLLSDDELEILSLTPE